MLVYNSSEFVYSKIYYCRRNCVQKIIFWFFVFTFLSRVCGLSENVMSLISFRTSSFL